MVFIVSIFFPTIIRGKIYVAYIYVCFSYSSSFVVTSLLIRWYFLFTLNCIQIEQLQSTGTHIHAGVIYNFLKKLTETDALDITLLHVHTHILIHLYFKDLYNSKRQEIFASVVKNEIFSFWSRNSWCSLFQPKWNFYVRMESSKSKCWVCFPSNIFCGSLMFIICTSLDCLHRPPFLQLSFLSHNIKYFYELSIDNIWYSYYIVYQTLLIFCESIVVGV